MARNTSVRNAVKLALAVNAGLLGLSAAPGALAQDQGAEELEEITVTGSRIKKKDFTSNAPVATVGFEQIQLTGTVNTESLLNTLPQAVPGFDRTSNNPGTGTATIDLRGLGRNRTLVLVDGVRVIPNESNGAVDINTIPNALIENIEVLTGGASAVYGSDAVAGVVNFILKDDFEGASVNGSWEQTEDGDAGVYSIDLTVGANVADGRGNVTLNMAWTEREELFQADRDFSFYDLDDNSDATGLQRSGSTGVPGTSIFSGAFDMFSPTSFGVGFNNVDGRGDIFPFVTTGDDNDYYNFAPVNYIQLPQTRYQSTALGHFDVSDRVTAYGRAMFTGSKVPQQLAPTPIFQTSSFTLDGSPFLTDASIAELQAFGDGVDSDGDGIDDTATAFVRRRMLEVGPRIVDSTFNSFQVMGGVRGDITENWSFDGYLQVGNTNGNIAQRGNVDRNRFDQALLLDLAADPTGNTCTDPSAGGSTVGCAGLNIFGEGNISEAAADFVRTSVNAAADYDQRIAALNFTGDSGGFELPGGPIGIAFGFESIEEDFSFDPSQDLASGNIAGFNGQPPVRGSRDVTAFYVETYLPILSGARFAEQLDLELAYRTSDYDTTGSVEAYKAAFSYAPVESFRLRGGYNRAVRAPSIGELFAPQGEGFPSATDPCSANGMPDAATTAICTGTGVPANVVGSPAINLAAGQVRGIFGGNPDLTEETADTYTFGFVWQPDMVEGLSMSIDYFNIEIDDYIASFGGGPNNILDICYNQAAGGVGSVFCNAVNRRPDGTIDFVQATSENIAEQTLKGIDILGSYDFDVWNGDMRIAYVGTWTDESDFTPFEGGEVIECAGNYGNLCGEPLAEYKHRATGTWSNDKWTAMLSWRYVGDVDDDDPDETFFVESIDGQHYFDLTGVYRFTDNYSISVGIDNVTDEDPPIIGGNDEQANTYPATYDVFGRSYFVRGSVDF